MGTMSFPLKTAFALAIFLSAGLAARTKTDVVVMSNGDRFTCEIKKLERGVLYASFDYVDGTVSLQWSKVARVESSQLFIVYVQDGSIYEGAIRTAVTGAQQPVAMEVLEATAQPAALPQANVVELAPASQSVWRRFSGNIDTGLMYTRGNDTTQYNVGAALRVRGEHWRAAADFASSFSKSSGVDAATRHQSRLWARRLIGGKRAWYYAGAAEFLQSSQQGIELQAFYGGGMGRFIKDTNSARFAVTAHLALLQTRYAPHLGDQSSPNALATVITGDLHLFKFKKSSFDMTASVLPVLTEAGRFRSYLNSAYSIQVINNLWFKFSFYGNWDNRPPKAFSGSDYGVSSGITYSFN
jgi:putative salt-induced outer membrane protein YdiY